MELINKITSNSLKINDTRYGCICNSHSAQAITNIWNGEVVVHTEYVIVSMNEGSELICVIDDKLKDDEVYKLK